jgi:hypothetical protein
MHKLSRDSYPFPKHSEELQVLSFIRDEVAYVGRRFDIILPTSDRRDYGLLPAITAPGVALGRSSGLVSPVARRISRSSTAASPATGSSSGTTTSVAPVTSSGLGNGLRAALRAVSEVLAVEALGIGQQG